MLKKISTDKAPAAIGPYSQAIEVNGMVFTSGVIPVNPATGEIPEGIEAQADQAIGNLCALLKESGTDADKVIKTTVFIKVKANTVNFIEQKAKQVKACIRKAIEAKL